MIATARPSCLYIATLNRGLHGCHNSTAVNAITKCYICTLTYNDGGITIYQCVKNVNTLSDQDQDFAPQDLDQDHLS